MDKLDPIAKRLSDALNRIDVCVNDFSALGDRRVEAAPSSEDVAIIGELRANLAAQAHEIQAMRAQIEHHHAVQDDAVEARSGASNGADLEMLRNALVQERSSREEFAARVQLLQRRSETTEQKHLKECALYQGRLEALDVQSQRLQQSNADLRDISGQLRIAVEQSVGDTTLINRAMQAELEALHAVRAAEAEEVGAVMDALKPIIEGAG